MNLMKALWGFTLVMTCHVSAMAATLTVNGDGTVTDPTTGLTWMRCSMGQTWSGSTCTGTANTYTWDQANALTGTVTFAGQSDWRVPNIRELQTIVDRTAGNPAINKVAFPNTPSSGVWSDSPSVGRSDTAEKVVFYLGYNSNDHRFSTLGVRLVRGGQSLGLLNPARPTTDYVDHGDGTATHTPTGLMWQRCAQGQIWSGGTCTGTTSRLTYDAAKAVTSAFAGKTDWRLPTAEELASLVDHMRSPAINPTIFPNASYSIFWSSSPSDSPSGYVWTVDFSSGVVYTYSRWEIVNVRLVRVGQNPAPITTTSTATTTTTTATTTTTTQAQTFTPTGSTTVTTPTNPVNISVITIPQIKLAQATSKGISATITPTSAEVGRAFPVYLGARMGNLLVFRGAGLNDWSLYQGGTIPVALQVAAMPPSLSVNIIEADLSAYPGLEIFASYGDMNLEDHTAKVYTVPAPPGSVTPPGPKISAVTPISAIQGRITTYTVTGTSLPDGLSFSLDGCFGIKELPGGNDTTRQFSCIVFDAIAKDGQIKNKEGNNSYFNFRVTVDYLAVANTLQFSSPLLNGDSIVTFPTPIVGSPISSPRTFAVNAQTFNPTSRGFVAFGFLYSSSADNNSAVLDVFSLMDNTTEPRVPPMMVLRAALARRPKTYDYGFPADVHSWNQCQVSGATEFAKADLNQATAYNNAALSGTPLTTAQKSDLQYAVDTADNRPLCADIGIHLDPVQGRLVFSGAQLALYESTASFLDQYKVPPKVITVDGTFEFTALNAAAIEQTAIAKAAKKAADLLAAKQAADSIAAEEAVRSAAIQAAADEVRAKQAADALAAKLAAEAHAAETAKGPVIPSGVVYACNSPTYYSCQEYYIGKPDCGTSTAIQLASACFRTGVIGKCVSDGLFTTYFYGGYSANTKVVCGYQPNGVWSAN